MKPKRALALVSAVGVVVLATAGCDKTVTGTAEPDPNATVTVTTTLSDEPTASPATTTTTQPPQTTAIPPGGADSFGVADPSRFQLNPPTPVASYAFSVPSHNINCFVGSEFICEIHDGPQQSPVDSRCGLYDGDSEVPVRIVGWFNYDKAPCSTILQGQWREPGAVLEYNERVRFSVPGAEFACYSTLEALYCTGPQNYGFKLSRTEFARYRLS
jgi:hypothetical protein